MTFKLQLRTIQHHMSLTREHIDNLVERFSNRPEPPPFYISEYRQILFRKNLIANLICPSNLVFVCKYKLLYLNKDRDVFEEGVVPLQVLVWEPPGWDGLLGCTSLRDRVTSHDHIA